MAMFGQGSFIQDPQAYTSSVSSSSSNSYCVSLAPLGYFMSQTTGGGLSTDPCILSTANDSSNVAAEIINWLSMFNVERGAMGNAFDAAAFLASTLR